MSDTNDQTSNINPQDKTKFIRTYAKDVAVLTGTKPVPPKAKAPEPTPPPAPSAWDRKPEPPPPAPAYRPEPAQDNERSEVLDRLRAKLSEHPIERPEPAPFVLPKLPSPPPQPPKPVFTPPPPPPPPLPVVKKVIEERPSPIHTYTSDFADRIDEKKASTFSVLAAEADAKKKAPIKNKKRDLAPIISGVLLVVVGVLGVGGASWYVLNMRAVPGAALSVPSLVFADEHMKLAGSGTELMQALADAADQPLVGGNVLITYLSESTTTPKGVTIETPLQGGALIRALQLPAPDILLRNVAPVSTVGIVSAGVESRPFFIFRVTSYERTFAGMLAWESTIGRDLAPLYPSYSAPTVNPEASKLNLGTSTPVSAATPPVMLAYFADAVVASHDVRVLKDSAGNTLMLYGYADKSTLILARDEAAFTTLLARLSATASK